jgi:ubiquitin carboxyl-terminal hydrolase L5
VDPTIYTTAEDVFCTSALPTAHTGHTFAPDFASIKLGKDFHILDMPVRSLVSAWEQCIKDAIPAKLAIEDELIKPRDAHVSSSPSLFLFLVLSNYFCSDGKSEANF